MTAIAKDMISGKPVTPESIVSSLIASSANVKTGEIFVMGGLGRQEAMSVELIEKNGWSLDIGATQSRLFAGISKDVMETQKMSLDIGAGITNRAEAYVGWSVSF